MAYALSVITPVYNAGATLARAVDSVRAQTLGFENIELILADDCSQDGSYELCYGLAAAFPNITALRLESNSGPGAARSAALDRVSAPRVMFLDSDDVYAPGACAALLEAMERERCDIVSGDFRTVVYDKRGRVKSAAPSYERFPEGRYDLSGGITPAAEPFLSAFWCKLYRMELIDRHSLRMRARSMYEELMFLCRYLGFSKSGYYLKENVTDYTVRPDSASRARDEHFFTSTAECIAETAQAAAGDGMPSLVADYLACSDAVGEHIDWLLGESGLSDEAFSRSLAAWEPVLSYCKSRSLATASPAARLLLADAGSESFAADAADLRAYALERRAELDGIFSSRTWRLARALQRLSPGGRR